MDYKPEMYSKPEIYSANAILQVTAADLAIAKFLDCTKGKEKIKCGYILDVACGEGTVTFNLMGKLDKNTKLEACDKSQEVIDYAQSKYGHLGIYFFVLDACDPVPSHLRGKYDLVFSNFFLHWTHEQRKVLQNFYDLLKEGGRCIITLVARQACFAAYRDLAVSPKWAKFLDNVNRFVTPYQDSDAPEEEFRTLLEEINFSGVRVHCEEVVTTDTLASHEALLQNIDPFYSRIPEELRRSYADDFMRAYIEEGGFINYNPNSGPEDLVERPCYVLFAFAEKKTLSN